jgi:meiosis-specific transcription factor NDT80
MTDTPRSILSTASMSLSPEGTYSGSTMGYQSGQDPRGVDTPPFAAQDDFHEILCNGHTVKPIIEANIEKGFFYSNDQCWTCYRRNYFSVQCSYTLTPHLPGQHLFLNRSGSRGQEQIQAMAMTLSAAVDGATGKTIELIQHTPKRDKGPQTAIQMTKLAPTPPGGKYATLTDAHSYSHGLAGYGHTAPSSTAPLPSPFLPLQNAQDSASSQDQPGYSTQPSSPTAHQHTFERIQFKSATANNGKRRAQQQYYHLIVELYADVRTDSTKAANWVKIAQRASSQVVVRGRSPSHYSNEGPHSAASHGGGSAGSSMGLMGGSAVNGGGGSGSIGLGRGLGNSYAYGGVSGYRGNQYMLETMPGGSLSGATSTSLNGAVEAFPPNPRKPYILSSNVEYSKHDNMESSYEYYPRAIYESILPPPVKIEARRAEFDRIKDEGLFGPGSLFHQSSRGVYSADTVY